MRPPGEGAGSPPEDGVLGVALAARSLAWRRGSALITLLLVALTVLAAALGPLWTRAGAESLLRDDLLQAPPAVTSFSAAYAGVPTSAALAGLDRRVADAGPLPRRLPPVRSLRLVAHTTLRPGAPALEVALAWRQDGCAHLRLTAGRCPQAAGEVLVHEGAARRAGLRVGEPVQAAVKSDLPPPNGPGYLPVRLRAVGTYRPRDPGEAYWTGHVGDFDVFPASVDGEPDLGQTLFTTPATFDAAARTYARGERPLGFAEQLLLLDVPAVRLRDAAALRGRDAAVTAAVASGDVRVTSGLVAPLDAAHSQGDRLRSAAVLVVGQLLVLAGSVLVLGVSASARARRPEVAGAKLRGLRRRTTVALAVREPLLLVVAAAPLGALGGWLVARLLASARLAPGTPVPFTGSAALAVLAALLAAALTAAVVCWRVLRRPALELWERAEPTTAAPGRLRVLRDGVAVLLLAGLAVVCRRAGDPYGMLVPVPMALAAAVVALRLLPWLAGRGVRRTRARPGIARFLVTRQLARRGDGARLAALVVVAAALAACGTAAWSVTQVAARDRAAVEVGAPVVVVAEPTGEQGVSELLAVVRRVDPTGRSAMAALDFVPFAGQPGGRLVAVDSSRLAAVASWRPDLAGRSAADTAAALTAPAGNRLPVVLTQGALRAAQPGFSPELVQITGLTGRVTSVLPVAAATALPRAGQVGGLVDLERAVAGTPPFEVRGLQEVWTLPGSEAAVTRGLRDSGYTVLRVEHAADRQGVLARQGPGLAVLLALVAAALTVLLVGGAVLAGVMVLARRRGYELAALASVGVPPPALRRSGSGETAAVLLVGTALGALAGWGGSLLSLPVLPIFDDDGGGVPVLLVPRAAPLLLLAAAGLALAALTSLGCGRALLGAAGADRLREAQA